MSASRPTVGIVGPLLGSNPGWVASPGQMLAHYLSGEGYRVFTASHKPAKVLRVIDTVQSLLRWGRSCDVLICLAFSGPAFGFADLAARFARWTQRPLILALHGGNLPVFADRHPRWVGRVLKEAAALVSPTPYLSRTFIERGFEVSVIPNVIEIDSYPFRARDPITPRIVWMRTFQDSYQPELALDVLHLVLDRQPDASLTMGGQDRGLLGHTRAVANTKGLSNHVRFLGFMDAEAKVRQFSAHDIYLNTTRVDNAPVSLIEAGAFGLPIVSTDAGGIPDLVADGSSALLYAIDDVSGMAAGIRRLLTEPGLAARLSHNGRALAESCAWSNVRPLWDSLFERVMAHV